MSLVTAPALLVAALLLGHHRGPPRAAPACKTDYGQTACGYHCIADDGQVKCARTEAGVCKSDYGQVVCWDPEPSCGRRARPECKSDYGQIACGYHCKSDGGQVKCAQTPEGVCRSDHGQVTCWDPQ